MRSLKIVLWMLAFLALTGLGLMLCYVPDRDSSFLMKSGQPIITTGSVFRGLHFWGSNFIVMAVAVHLARTVFVKTNRQRFGGALAIAVLTGLFWFTGMLLPWDQLTYWLPSWACGLRGIYWTHTLALSLLMLPLLAVYLRRTRRDFMPGLGS